MNADGRALRPAIVGGWPLIPVGRRGPRSCALIYLHNQSVDYEGLFS
jgi:hypothetical protein